MAGEFHTGELINAMKPGSLVSLPAEVPAGEGGEGGAAGMDAEAGVPAMVEEGGGGGGAPPSPPSAGAKRGRAAAIIAQKDPTVKELKAKQNEMRKQAEFASPDEKKNMRNDFEVLMADLRKANLAAISKAAPSLAKDTLEKIFQALEDRMKAAAKKAPAKATKTPLKPFPFGEKK